MFYCHDGGNSSGRGRGGIGGANDGIDMITITTRIKMSQFLSVAPSGLGKPTEAEETKYTAVTVILVPIERLADYK